MRAIWIDARSRGVTEVDVINLEDMQEHVGGLITVAVEYENGDTVYVDDEGLLKDPKHFFMIGNCPRPFAGNGLIVGCDHETGESIHAKSSLEAVKRSVKFLDGNTVRLLILSRN